MKETEELRQIYQSIQRIGQEAEKLQKISENQSIAKNAERILACVNILNLNICDVLDLS